MNLLPFFLTGLLGAAHCIGMCGGIVSAFSLAGPAAPPSGVRPFPVPVTGAAAVPATRSAAQLLAFNSGRVASYAVAGALAGGLSGGLASWMQLSTLQIAGYALANVMLILIGLFLMDAWHGLSALETVGQRLWQRVRPALRFVLPVDSVPKAAALGTLWGWMPCGMVYSVLVTAMLSGSAANGAQVMAAFGLGTVPAMFGAGLLGARLREFTRKPVVRRIAGLTVLAFGVFGMLRLLNVVGHGVGPAWLDVFCITPGQH